MEIPGYSLDFKATVNEIKKNKYATVAAQLPEGLKKYMQDIVLYLEQTVNAKIIVMADPCFGACDLSNHELKSMNVDCLIQIGHTKIPDLEKYMIPTFFINAQSTLNIDDVVKKAIPILEGSHIGLVTTAQHLHMLDRVGLLLKDHSLQPIVSKGDTRISSKGQILGCNFSAGMNIKDKIDCFLFIGSGTFHPVGLLLSSKKPVIAADPYTNIVKKQELDDLKDAMLRQRYGAIANSHHAKTFGILISTKKGQQRLNCAYDIKKLLESYGKKSVVIAMDAFSSEALQGFSSIDCLISTACPRIAIDDYMKYKIPILTPIELEIVLGKRKWEDYTFDEIPGT